VEKVLLFGLMGKLILAHGKMVDNMVGENIMEVMEKLKLENGLKEKGLNGLVARKKES
jgi:hypothetical protein